MRIGKSQGRILPWSKCHPAGILTMDFWPLKVWVVLF